MTVLRLVWLLAQIAAYVYAMYVVVVLCAVAIVAPPIAAWKVVRR